ncbi:NAD-binding protein [Nocardioides psychrotolerans]|uniref:potassium channel family protein n=1 Tax=Nocardioides psychrotolerans TaxID=1005945 RepID=UPI00313831AB
MRRIAVALGALLAVTVFGTVGYVLLGFTFMEALYQTVTTVATVGFREVRPFTTAGQVFTIVLIALGVGTVLYNLGVLMEAVTEGHLRDELERRRMNARIAALRGHVIVCGHGRVGRAAADFLVAGGHRVVVVDSDPARLGGLGPQVEHVLGDVTDDDVLRAAGIASATAVIVALETDADTVYVTLSARAMRPDVTIVSRARTTGSTGKLELAGATRAVNPQRIGGRRLAVFALQPDVAEFLDVVMHDEDLDWRIEQVEAGPGIAGRTLAGLEIQQRTGALLLAIRRTARAQLEANPPGDLEVPEGAVLIALGTPSELAALAALVA